MVVFSEPLEAVNDCINFFLFLCPTLRLPVFSKKKSELIGPADLNGQLSFMGLAKSIKCESSFSNAFNGTSARLNVSFLLFGANEC